MKAATRFCASAVTSGRPSTIAVAPMMRSIGSEFSVFGDEHRLRFDPDFVHDGGAVGFENTGRYRF